jgi:hypothetical protein
MSHEYDDTHSNSLQYQPYQSKIKRESTRWERFMSSISTGYRYPYWYPAKTKRPTTTQSKVSVSLHIVAFGTNATHFTSISSDHALVGHSGLWYPNPTNDHFSPVSCLVDVTSHKSDNRCLAKSFRLFSIHYQSTKR